VACHPIFALGVAGHIMALRGEQPTSKCQTKEKEKEKKKRKRKKTKKTSLWPFKVSRDLTNPY
jgi:hypothetical protein